MGMDDIIASVCPTNVSCKLVKKILVVLIDQAKKGVGVVTYGELSRSIGYEDGRFSGIGKQLGYVHDVIKRFSEVTHEDIPTLNGLVVNSKTYLPSTGFDYVIPTYDDFSVPDKKKLVDIYNIKAFSYENWDWVLSSLGVTRLSIPSSSEKVLRTGRFGGGEGDEHRSLKEYIAKHPSVVGVESSAVGQTEYYLLSGDRLDVFFPDSNSVVEVKPTDAPEYDVLRGIFQCVKYKAVIEAECVAHGVKKSSNVVLALGGRMSEENRKIATALKVKVIEEVSNIFPEVL